MHIVFLIITFLAFGPEAQIHYGVASFDDNTEGCEIVADALRAKYAQDSSIMKFSVFCEDVEPGDSV